MKPKCACCGYWINNCEPLYEVEETLCVNCFLFLWDAVEQE
jgi:hypothetical protein